MSEFSLAQWTLAVLGALLIGLSKTGIAGLGVLTVAIYANILPARQSTGIILPMLICADVVAVAAYRRHAVWTHLRRLFPWVAAGIVLGFLAMTRMNDTQVRRLIGATVLVLVGLHLWRRRPGREPTPDTVPHSLWFAAVTGVCAGFTTMMANAAGPIMVLYMLAIGLPKMELLGTGAWYFLILNLFKLPFSYRLGLITPASLTFNLTLAPVVILGALGGSLIAKRINQRLFETLTLAMTLLAGLRLLV